MSSPSTAVLGRQVRVPVLSIGRILDACEDRGELGSRRDVELGVDVADVGFDGVDRHDELAADVRIRGALGDEASDFAFGWRETVPTKRWAQAWPAGAL